MEIGKEIEIIEVVPAEVEQPTELPEPTNPVEVPEKVEV